MENFIKQLIDNNIEKSLIDKLTTLLSNTNGKFYIIYPKENKFSFPYLLYIPNKLESNTLILHGNNLAQEEGNIMNIYSAVFETTASAGYDLLNLNQPIIVPVTSNYIHPANNNMHEFFPMQASRNVLFCSNPNNTYYKLFEQINNMIDDCRNFIFEKINTTIAQKIICHGFSSSAKFVLRYATCYPERVSLLIAGGFGNQAFVPLEKIAIENKKIELIYPIGIKDINHITGKPFDCDNFKEMKQFYFIGAEENEDNDTAFNFRHTDEDIKNIYEKVFGNIYQSRFDKLVKIYKDLGYNNVEFVRYPNYGHSSTPGIKHTTELILKYRNLKIGGITL